MKTTVKLEGLDELQDKLRLLGIEAKREVDKAVQATGLEIRGDIVKRIQKGPKTGAVYDSVFARVNGRVVPVGPRQGNNLSATHQASAPGEAPATDTGLLASRIIYKKEGQMSATVGSNVVYAAYLEFGAPRAKIEPRPAWVPATEAMRPKFRQRLETALARAAK